MKSRRMLGWLAVLAVVVALYLGRWAWTAHQNLVTLNVRNLDVRDVVRKIEWQVWEVIYVDKAVEGKVTLNVKRMPLEQVLALVAGQTLSRPSVFYPLYSNSRSFTALKKSLRGEIDPATSGWTNLAANPFGGMMGFGLPGLGMAGMGGPGGALPGNGLVSLTILNQDVAFAALAFSRFAQARVVPEDGTTETINVTIDKAPVDKAVAKLAKAVKRDWTKIYALQDGFRGMRGPGGPPQFAMRDDGGERGGPPRQGLRDSNAPPQFGFGGPRMTEEQMDEFRKKREKLEEDLKQTLPVEERQKLESAQQERQKLMEEMANMTDDQRRERMMQMMGGGGQMDKMMRERLLNSTPEQRAQMGQRMGGPGGPGGGGRGGPGGGR